MVNDILKRFRLINKSGFLASTLINIKAMNNDNNLENQEIKIDRDFITNIKKFKEIPTCNECNNITNINNDLGNLYNDLNNDFLELLKNIPLKNEINFIKSLYDNKKNNSKKNNNEEINNINKENYIKTLDNFQIALNIFDEDLIFEIWKNETYRRKLIDAIKTYIDKVLKDDKKGNDFSNEKFISWLDKEYEPKDELRLKKPCLNFKEFLYLIYLKNIINNIKKKYNEGGKNFLEDLDEKIFNILKNQYFNKYLGGGCFKKIYVSKNINTLVYAKKIEKREDMGNQKERYITDEDFINLKKEEYRNYTILNLPYYICQNFLFYRNKDIILQKIIGARPLSFFKYTKNRKGKWEYEFVDQTKELESNGDKIYLNLLCYMCMSINDFKKKNNVFFGDRKSNNMIICKHGFPFQIDIDICSCPLKSFYKENNSLMIYIKFFLENIKNLKKYEYLSSRDISFYKHLCYYFKCYDVNFLISLYSDTYENSPIHWFIEKIKKTNKSKKDTYEFFESIHEIILKLVSSYKQESEKDVIITPYSFIYDIDKGLSNKEIFKKYDEGDFSICKIQENNVECLNQIQEDLNDCFCKFLDKIYIYDNYNKVSKYIEAIQKAKEFNDWEINGDKNICDNLIDDNFIDDLYNMFIVKEFDNNLDNYKKNFKYSDEELIKKKYKEINNIDIDLYKNFENNLKFIIQNKNEENEEIKKFINEKKNKELFVKLNLEILGEEYKYKIDEDEECIKLVEKKYNISKDKFKKFFYEILKEVIKEEKEAIQYNLKKIIDTILEGYDEEVKEKFSKFFIDEDMEKISVKEIINKQKIIDILRKQLNKSIFKNVRKRKDEEEEKKKAEEKERLRQEEEERKRKDEEEKRKKAEEESVNEGLKEEEYINDYEENNDKEYIDSYNGHFGMDKTSNSYVFH